MVEYLETFIYLLFIYLCSYPAVKLPQLNHFCRLHIGVLWGIIMGATVGQLCLLAPAEHRVGMTSMNDWIGGMDEYAYLYCALLESLANLMQARLA